MIKAGDRFYSKYFKNYGTVTRYVDNDNWWFKLDSKKFLKIFIINYPEYKARVRPVEVSWL